MSKDGVSFSFPSPGPFQAVLARDQVVDVQGDIPGRPDGWTIYGDDLCHQFAWKNEPNVNPRVAANGK